MKICKECKGGKKDLWSADRPVELCARHSAVDELIEALKFAEQYLKIILKTPSELFALNKITSLLASIWKGSGE